MTNSDNFTQAARNVVQNCLKIKANEEVLIITDPPRKNLAELIYNEVKEISANAEIILLPDPKIRKKQPLQTPSSILKGAIRESDVTLTFFELIPLELRPFRITIVEEAKRNGRVGHMVGADRSSFENGLLANYDEVAECSDTLATILSMANKLCIKSGMNFEYELNFNDLGGWNEIASSDSGILEEKGSYGNLPAGEAFMAISLSRSVKISGKICIDNYITEVGHIDITRPVILNIEKGEVTDIPPCEIHEGRNPAIRFKNKLNTAKKEAKNKNLDPKNVCKIAEIGIGTNPNAEIGESIIETEKRRGTIHIALGDNTTFGGTNKAPNHYDCVISNAILIIDDATILEKGVLKNLRTLKSHIEKSHYEMNDEKIDNQSLIIKSDSEVILKDNELFKKWKDYENRTHLTKVGGDLASNIAAQTWGQMENNETVAELLAKVDLQPKIVYQVLRLFEQFLLISIKEHTVMDSIKHLQNDVKKNFIDVSDFINSLPILMEKGYEQEIIYLKEISNNIGLLNKNITSGDLIGISERVIQIEANTNEILRSDSEILSSKLTISAPIAPFLGISGTVDMKELLTKINEKVEKIKRSF